MMLMVAPNDPDLLAALGRISVLHGHLDYILRMTVKSLAEVSIREALDATERQTSGPLRERVHRLAKQKLGDGTALIKLEALLERCRRATEKRNDLMHSLWAHELDGEPKMRTSNHDWKDLPTVDELNELSEEFASLAQELNATRQEGGYLFHASDTGRKPVKTKAR